MEYDKEFEKMKKFVEMGFEICTNCNGSGVKSHYGKDFVGTKLCPVCKGEGWSKPKE